MYTRWVILITVYYLIEDTEYLLCFSCFEPKCYLKKQDPCMSMALFCPVYQFKIKKSANYENKS